MPASDPQGAWVVLGRVAGAYGLRGWLKIESHTEPRAGIVAYRQWWVGVGSDRRRFDVVGGRRHGRGVVAGLAGVTDRAAASALHGEPIAVPRSALPDTEGYYWADLIGLVVENREGRVLGRISGYLPTGGHDVMVVTGGDRERLIPWAPGRYVDEVRFADGRIRVDWHPED